MTTAPWLVQPHEQVRALEEPLPRLAVLPFGHPRWSGRIMLKCEHLPQVLVHQFIADLRSMPWDL